MDVYKLINTVRSILDDIARFSHEIDVNGDIEYRIDSTKYNGSYEEMVEGINAGFGGLINDVVELMDMLMELGQGKEIEPRKFPGKKAVINERIGSLTETLYGIHDEISKIAKGAADGNLHIQADASKYQGEWGALISDLNALVQAVREPILEIEHCLIEMAEGNFESVVTGNYKGDFDAVKKAVNTTGKTTLSYVKEISEILSAISEGDLTVSVKQKYIGSYAPIKNALVQILESLNQTMSDIDASAQQVLAGAGQISQSAMELAEGSTRQASAIEQLSASIEVINSKTKQNSENADNANDFSQNTSKDAAISNQEMKSMMSSMEEIKDSSSSISKINKTIQDIAFQTNLLALNAAVEAARAGEHGKGFAVVAEEVRSLAGRSQNAAKETTLLIEDSIKKVDGGMDAANGTAESLGKIVDGVHRTSELISQIATMSQEQAESVAHINIGINEISSVVQSNSATSEECAAASQELNSQTELLKQKVAFFKLK